MTVKLLLFLFLLFLILAEECLGFIRSSCLQHTLEQSRGIRSSPFRLGSGRYMTTEKTMTKTKTIKMMVAVPSLPVLLLSAASFATRKINSISLVWKAVFLSLFALWNIVRQNMDFDLNRHLKGAVNAMEKKWTIRGPGSAVTRSLQVWTFAIAWYWRFRQAQRLQKGGTATATLYSQKKTELAVLLRDKLLDLGPTYIKLGQLLSTRIDVLDKEYIKELSRLQDQVPSFDGALAVRIIETELGSPINQLFDTFNTTSIAAASLGQVHVATKNGQKLAIKIQRQGLKALFDRDLKNIKLLAWILDKLDNSADGAQRDWGTIYSESARLLYKEIDYENEAKNAIRFRENFKDIPWVKVPEVYLNQTTTNVITMEYVGGIKISNIEAIDQAGIDRTLLARRSAEAYLTQLCRHGFFHCDPHPGNVACDEQEGGRLIFYDFGMMDELKADTKTGLVNLIFGIYENDVKEVLRALEQIEVLRKGVDKFAIEKVARVFLRDFNEGIGQGGKWLNEMSPEEQRKVTMEKRKQLGADLFSVGSDVPFKFPTTFTFVFRAFTSLDGIGKGLDPAYDLVRLAQPYLKELVDLRDGSAFISLLKTWGKKLGWRPIDIAHTVQQPRKVAYLEETVGRMEQGDLILRVRVLESERAFQRMELVQSNIATAIAASTFLNIGILLSIFTLLAPTITPAITPSMASTIIPSTFRIINPTTRITSTMLLSIAAKFFLGCAGFFGIQIPFGIRKIRKFDKQIAELL